VIRIKTLQQTCCDLRPVGHRQVVFGRAGEVTGVSSQQHARAKASRLRTRSRSQPREQPSRTGEDLDDLACQGFFREGNGLFTVGPLMQSKKGRGDFLCREFLVLVTVDRAEQGFGDLPAEDVALDRTSNRDGQ